MWIHFRDLDTAEERDQWLPTLHRWGVKGVKIDFMDSEAQTICPETHLLSVAQVFLLTPYRRLPVLEEGKLIGIVSRQDVMKCWMHMMDSANVDSREAVLVQFSEMFQWGEAPLA